MVMEKGDFRAPKQTAARRIQGVGMTLVNLQFLLTSSQPLLGIRYATPTVLQTTLNVSSFITGRRSECRSDPLNEGFGKAKRAVASPVKLLCGGAEALSLWSHFANK